MSRLLAIIAGMMLLGAVVVGVLSISAPTKPRKTNKQTAVVTAAMASDDPALPPLYDVPRLDRINVDGSGTSWGDRGMRVHQLANTSGKVQPENDIDADFRLGWNETGLLVLVTVHDDIPVEDSNPINGDSVELYLSTKVGDHNTIRAAIAPGIDPQHPKMRMRVLDLRTDPALRKAAPHITAARTKVDGGYIIEALLPWSNLNITPRMGMEVGFQLQVNDLDAQGQGSHLVWYPSLGTSRDPSKMQRLRLAASPAPTVSLAAFGDYPRFHRTRITVTGSPDLAGHKVEIVRKLPPRTAPQVVSDDSDASDDDDSPKSTPVATSGPIYKTLVRGKMDTDFVRPEIASAILTMPMPERGETYGTLDVLIDGRRAGVVDLPDPGKAASWILPEQLFVFKPCVFSTRAFPEGDFEDSSYVEDLVGSYETKITFYDADYNVVTTAEKPGRYGAVVDVRTEDGQTFKRYHTLFREANDFSWRNTDIPFTVKLPREMGISAAALKMQSQSVNTYFKELLHDEGVNRDSDTAVLMAGLFETRPSDQPLLRNSAASMDRAWWAGLKKKVGEPLYKHLVYLPVGYGELSASPKADEAKAKNEEVISLARGTAGLSQKPLARYPLVLFLHGKGERGDNLLQIKEAALPSRLEYDQKFREKFPAILLAPQCPSNGWWSTHELSMLIDEIQAKYRVDPDRIYVTGMSMGGYGTWAMASEFPERFAAIAPVCGGGDVAEAERLAHLPIWAFHGNKDNVVPFNESQKMVSAVQAIGGNIRLTAYAEAGHDAWTETYSNPELFTWLFAQKRSARPTTPVKTSPQIAGVTAPTTQPLGSAH